MVILFLTGSLEPGKDGVGDYTRLLARECVRQNHSCRLVALNDPHVAAPVESEECSDGPPIAILRLPSAMAWSKRIELAQAFKAQQPPEWISLQFVSYAFDPKGLVRNLPRHLQPLVAGSHLHIMFHELWIGSDSSEPLKDRVVGQIQRFYI